MFYPRVLAIRTACFFFASAFTLAVLSVGSAQDADEAAEGPVLNPSHPETYVVQEDDTLWDIAAMFLRDPWYWPEIWQINPQVENPHLIYPGDLLRLTYLNGQPRIERDPQIADVTVLTDDSDDVAAQPAASALGRTERLSPNIRYQTLEQAIPTVNADTLRAFLSEATVLTRRQMRRLPYIIDSPRGIMGSAGRDLYVRGTDDPEGTRFRLVQIGNELIDPDSNDLLGFETIHTGEGTIRRTGDPATLIVTDSTREILPGDFLLPLEEEMPTHFLPRPPEREIDGRIISVVDGASLIGQYQVVTINRGERDGLAPGHVLTADKRGRRILDRHHPRRRTQKVNLPDEPAGTIMVFRTFERMSYALVMRATQSLSLYDNVRNPI